MRREQKPTQPGWARRAGSAGGPGTSLSGRGRRGRPGPPPHPKGSGADCSTKRVGERNAGGVAAGPQGCLRAGQLPASAGRPPGRGKDVPGPPSPTAPTPGYRAPEPCPDAGSFPEPGAPGQAHWRLSWTGPGRSRGVERASPSERGPPTCSLKGEEKPEASPTSAFGLGSRFRSSRAPYPPRFSALEAEARRAWSILVLT